MSMRVWGKSSDLLPVLSSERDASRLLVFPLLDLKWSSRASPLLSAASPATLDATLPLEHEILLSIFKVRHGIFAFEFLL
jgi:hypothetical protein